MKVLEKSYRELADIRCCANCVYCDGYFEISSFHCTRVEKYIDSLISKALSSGCSNAEYEKIVCLDKVDLLGSCDYWEEEILIEEEQE